MNRKKQNRPNNLHTPRKDVFLRRGFTLYAAVISACLLATPALAATTDPAGGHRQSEHLYFQCHPCRRPDPAGLGHCPDWPCRCKAMTPASAARAF